MNNQHYTAAVLRNALASYVRYMYTMDISVNHMFIAGYRYINDSNCRLAPGYPKCYILGVCVDYGCKVIRNSRKHTRSILFNKTVLDIMFPLYYIEC